MKRFLLIALCALPLCGMSKDIEKAKKEAYTINLSDSIAMLALAATHTTVAVKAVPFISTWGIPITVALALNSDYFMTKYAKDSK
jgi:hypothetical protein